MRNFIFVLLVLVVFPLHGQRFFIQIQPGAGISSFTPGLMQFDPHASFQCTFSGGLILTERTSVQLGIGLQQAGARSTVTYSSPTPSTEVFQHPVIFLKVPVDYSIRIGGRGLFTLDIGAYYNLNISNLSEDWGMQGDFLALSEEDLSKDDVGLRLRPAIEIPFTQRSALSLGILQEFGLFAFVPRTHHYNTYLSAGVKVKL